jgi:acyl transferase domain-containing protein
LSQYLEERQQDLSENSLDDLAFTLAERRSAFSWRAAVSADSAQELIHKLRPNNIKFFKVSKSATVGFVFTGQGAQWPKMGMELMSAYPVFKYSLVRAEECLKRLGASWSLIGKT